MRSKGQFQGMIALYPRFLAAIALACVSLSHSTEADTLLCTDCCGGDVPVWVILFDSGSAEITHKWQRMVIEDALAASRYPFKYVSVVGYADRAGSEADNMALSLRRAETVRGALIQGGIAPRAITVSGRGEGGSAVPTADGKTETANRRVVVEFRDPCD